MLLFQMADGLWKFASIDITYCLFCKSWENSNVNLTLGNAYSKGHVYHFYQLFQGAHLLQRLEYKQLFMFFFNFKTQTMGTLRCYKEPKNP